MSRTTKLGGSRNFTQTGSLSRIFERIDIICIRAVRFLLYIKTTTTAANRVSHLHRTVINVERTTRREATKNEWWNGRHRFSSFNNKNGGTPQVRRRLRTTSFNNNKKKHKLSANKFSSSVCCLTVSSSHHFNIIKTSNCTHNLE